jgi:nucleotide-binding universal stress UspA family protein
MIRTIVVAYDGSEPADRAFALALELARGFRAGVCVVGVATPPRVPGDVEAEAAIETGREYLEKRFAALKSDPAAKDVGLKFEVLVGHPADHLVDYARQANVDLIVIGHRSRSLLGRLVLGSAAKHVIDHAHCPVLVVR